MVLSLPLFAFISIIFLAYLGYGVVRLLLPRDWRSAEGLLAPLVGYVLLLLVGYYAVRTVLNLFGALIVVLVLATLLNGLALWRRWGARPLLTVRQHGPAWLIALAAFVLAILPLLAYGYSAPIGENWDPENYLPVTEYLVRVPRNQIMEMPASPLRELNADPPRIGLTLGFSILQGTLQQLLGWDARQSFAPTIAVLYGLTALALYTLFHQGFGMSRRASLLATLFGGLYALALWIAFFNFGMQMSALPLVPLALALWLAALREPSWRTVVLSGATVAALPVAYYPALTVFVPVALGLGLHELVRARPRWTRLVAGLGTALLAPALAWGTILDYQAGFSYRYSQQMTTLGLFHFPSWAQVLGLSPFSRTEEALATAWTVAQFVGLFLLLLAAALALWRSPKRWLWMAALAPAILYLGWLRGWFWPLATALEQREVLSAALAERFRSYPYAFVKGAVFVIPLLLGLAAEGWDKLWQLTAAIPRSPRLRLGQAALAALLVVPLALSLYADGRLVARYWQQPSHFDHDVIRVEGAVDLLPPGASVHLTGRPERSRVVLGIFAYFLRDHPLQGRLSTAYGALDQRPPGSAPPFALLDADDDPHALGFLPAERLWSGGGMALYQRDPAVTSFLDLREDAYSQRPAAEVRSQEPLAERLLQGFGACPTASAEQPLVLYSDAQGLSRRDDRGQDGGTRTLLLGIATLEQVTITLRWADGTTEQAMLTPGFSTYRSRPHQVPTRVEIFPQGLREVFPFWAALRAESQEAAIELRPEVAVMRLLTVASQTSLNITLPLRNHSQRPLRLALEVWENTFHAAHHYAWWGPLLLPEEGSVFLSADLQERRAYALLGNITVSFDAHPGALDWPEVADGSYFAALWVYYGSHVLEVLPVGQFRVEDGQVQDLQGLDLSTRLVWPHSPGETSGAHFGPAIELSAYERGYRRFRPGESVPLALEWHALERVPVNYAVSAQIAGQGQLYGQWDGPVGQAYSATMWRPGQYIRDDIPLQVAQDAPPGRYRLIVVVYDPATGVRLPVNTADGTPLGDALDLGEIIVR